MRNRYNEELAELNVQLITMGALCEDAIHTASKALNDGSEERIQEIQKMQREIEQMDRKLENTCTRLILQQQPVAGDLRNITAALRMIYDMNRIGIQASDIAEMVEYVAKNPLKDTVHIIDMANTTAEMVSDSIDSFVKRDKQTALEVIKYDDVVDRLFEQTKKELIDVVESRQGNAEAVLDMLMIAKYFERIGDHAENIAHWVYYSITGKHHDEAEEQ